MLLTPALLALGPGLAPPQVPAAPPPEGPTDLTWVRGVTISCQSWGREWGTPGFEQELDELRALGVNWVAIHPYARLRGDGGLEWRTLADERPPAWLAVPVAAARARGMGLLVKPHLAYWGSPFACRGDVDFPDAEARARFYGDYERWIREVARATRGADAFVVGTELDRMTRDEAEWRRLIAAVREETEARLTFASNWDSFAVVPFWDALDAVGVQAYFPLTQSPEPTRGEVARGWEAVLPRLRDVSLSCGKPVVFTELGYDASPDAARSPWASAGPGADPERGRALQGLCLDVALEVLEREREWLRGGFLWKWFVGEAPGEDFLLDAPHVRAVLGTRWSR